MNPRRDAPVSWATCDDRLRDCVLRFEREVAHALGADYTGTYLHGSLASVPSSRARATSISLR